MELSRQETRTLVLALGVAIEKEAKALEGLRYEVRQIGISTAITQRQLHLNELDRLRQRLLKS